MICNLHFIFVFKTRDAVVPLVPELAKHTVSAQLLAGDVEDEDEGDVDEDVDGDNDNDCNKDGDDRERYFTRKMVMMKRKEPNNVTVKLYISTILLN